MDLRPYIKTPGQLDRARDLVRRGLMIYQPFRFSDDLETGVGYEFNTSIEDGGLIRWADVPPELENNPDFSRYLLNGQSANAKVFGRANDDLRRTYDGFVEETCRAVGDIGRCTFADIGCNSGYFPVRFAQAGAAEAVGYDREDFSETFAFLNHLLETDARFEFRGYDQQTGRVPDCPQYDVVFSTMVICHLTDVLQHLHFLGSIARRALFIWTMVREDDSYSITFAEPNKYFRDKPFPYCFDDLVRPSPRLLRKSLELMGFSSVIEIPNRGIPQRFFGNPNLGLLGLR